MDGNGGLGARAQSVQCRYSNLLGVYCGLSRTLEKSVNPGRLTVPEERGENTGCVVS